MSKSKEGRLLNELRFHQVVTEAMLGDSDLDQILFFILAGITHQAGLGFDRALLFLADESGRELRAASAVGPFDQEQAQRKFQDQASEELDLAVLSKAFRLAHAESDAPTLAERLAGFVVPVSASAPPLADGDENVPAQALVAHCAALKQTFFSNTIRAVFQPPAGSGGEVLQFSCMAGIPLRLKASVLGVLLVDNTFSERPIEQNEIGGLLTLGNLAVTAIENSRMNQRLAEMASRDGLTGVYNRRYYQSRLDKEVDLAKQGGRALGLLVFHLNDFKQCNDTHGYECGDQVLVDLAAFLRKGVRTEDLIARYGEAEFLVMLTGGASQEEAQIVADKLMSQVTSQSFGGLPAGKIVISCGIAWMPPEELDREAISRLADEALAQTKQKAGVCVVLAGH